MKPKNTPKQVLAFVLTGKKKAALIITTYERKTTAIQRPFAHGFFNATERHIRTGQPDGYIHEGTTEEFTCKAISASAPYLVDGRVKFPDWLGKTLSVNRRRYTITETTSQEQRGFIQFEIKAVRHTHEHRIINFR